MQLTKKKFLTLSLLLFLIGFQSCSNQDINDDFSTNLELPNSKTILAETLVSDILSANNNKELSDFLSAIVLNQTVSDIYDFEKLNNALSAIPLGHTNATSKSSSCPIIHGAGAPFENNMGWTQYPVTYQNHINKKYLLGSNQLFVYKINRTFILLATGPSHENYTLNFIALNTSDENSFDAPAVDCVKAAGFIPDTTPIEASHYIHGNYSIYVTSVQNPFRYMTYGLINEVQNVNYYPLIYKNEPIIGFQNPPSTTGTNF